MEFKPLVKAGTGTVIDFLPIRLIKPEEAVGAPGFPRTPSEPATPAGAAALFQHSLEEAVSAAFQNGFAKGEQQALETADRKLASNIAAWEKSLSGLCAGFHRELENFFELVEERSIKLTVAIAEKIIRRELSREPQVLGELIAGALAGLKDETRIQLRLRPEDKEFVDSWLAKSRDHLPELSITTDYQIEGGGFVIDTQAGSLDYALQNQLKRIETELESLYVQT